MSYDPGPATIPLGVSVRGGHTGMTASLEDLAAIIAKLDAAAAEFEKADAALRRASAAVESEMAWVGGAIVEAFPDAALTAARLASAEATGVALQSPAGAGACGAQARALQNAVCEARDLYIEAERENRVAVMSLRDTLYEMGENAVAEVLEQLSNPLLGPASWLANLFHGLVLAEGFVAAGGLVTDGCYADFLRRNYYELVDVADDLFPAFDLPLPETTESVAAKLGRLLRGFNALGGAPLAGVTVEGHSLGEGQAAGGLAGLAGLVRLAAAASPSGGQRSLVVDKVTLAGGGTGWVVAIPGTVDMTGRAEGHGRDMITNLEAVAGQGNDVLGGAVEALRQAGVKAGEPIVVAGHSQGGIVAAQLAQAATERLGLTVAGVMTMGSPIANQTVPEAVPVVALEHRQDIVPALSGPVNPDRRGLVTVTRDLAVSDDPAELAATANLVQELNLGDTLIAAHDSAAYQRTAAMAQDLAAVQPFLASAGPVLNGISVERSEYVITRTDSAGVKPGAAAETGEKGG
jgi:hypothetical protein